LLGVEIRDKKVQLLTPLQKNPVFAPGGILRTTQVAERPTPRHATC